jgi:catechol 2,3-dioxygenase
MKANLNMTSEQMGVSQGIGIIHPATRLGYVHYTAANLDRLIPFYTNVLGFSVHWQEGGAAGLGAGGDDLLQLTENRNARRVRGTTGLYHTAFLVPTRLELAQLLRRIAETRTPIEGMTNHGTHLAIYLPDAEGNGIELAWDFPRDMWPRSVEEMMSRHRGLTPQEVFQPLQETPVDWQGLDAGTQVGHVHLHVSRIPETEKFYRHILGFEVPFEFAGQAMFFSVGGYHHHIGTNVWNGVGAPRPPADATGLRYFTVILPDTLELEHVLGRISAAGLATESVDDGVLVRDPAGNGIRFVAKS